MSESTTRHRDKNGEIGKKHGTRSFERCARAMALTCQRVR